MAGITLHFHGPANVTITISPSTRPARSRSPRRAAGATNVVPRTPSPRHFHQVDLSAPLSPGTLITLREHGFVWTPSAAHSSLTEQRAPERPVRPSNSSLD